MSTYFSEAKLLSPPVERAAFSDRQAYVCAVLSKLAYLKFEGGQVLEDVIALVKEVIRDDERLERLESQLRLLLSVRPGDAAEGEAALRSILVEGGFQLVRPFNQEGTQAFFCTKTVASGTGTTKTIGYLVFRGTEPREFDDIQTDVRASLKPIKVDGETIEFHSGYLAAFESVRQQIEQALSETVCDQLIVTGHSLGGALAMVATRLLAVEVTGACYTFGAPPIGTETIQNNLKTPVYEIVNEIDIVPRLPNPWTATGLLVLLRLLRLLAKSVTLLHKVLASGTWDDRLEAFVEAMTRYRHPGYVSYLVGTGDAARLRYNVSSFDRLRWWVSMTVKRRIWQFKKMVTDHSIDVYIAKLRVHALRRQ